MELTAPAGNFQKLRFALAWGADAVYAGGLRFGLRAGSENFSPVELATAAAYCQARGRKLYVTMNAYLQDSEYGALREDLRRLADTPVSGIIVSDPGVFTLARKLAPHLPIHISTQANVTSSETARFWKDLGAKRVIPARELDFPEIVAMTRQVPGLEVEMFLHGAMCMSYSGRCLLSSYLNARSSNRGDCSHPCRWRYALTEETRPGQYFPVWEDDRGSYILNSRDLCLYDRLPEIVGSGIHSGKIEGRMKSLLYVALVTRAYRQAIDAIKKGETANPSCKEDLYSVSHRPYTEGFFNGFDNDALQWHESATPIPTRQFVGEISEVDGDWITVSTKRGITKGDIVEILFPDPADDCSLEVGEIRSMENLPVTTANPNNIVRLKTPFTSIPPWGLIAKSAS